MIGKVGLGFAAATVAGWFIASAMAFPRDTSTALVDRQWVAFGVGGKLEYKTTPQGDRIMDFSHVGYMGGGVAIPTLPVKKDVAPSSGDDTAAIQAAIDQVSAMPLVKGFRGAVLLKSGVFHCGRLLNVNVSGVVLRGTGMGEGGTAIEMTGSPHTCLVIGKSGRRSFQPARNATAVRIADAYVPSGAIRVNTESVVGLAVGDSVLIRRPITQQWIEFMGMDKLVRNGKRQTWIGTTGFMSAERTIRDIQGNCITLDAPLSDSIDSKFTGDAGPTLAKAELFPRIMHSGVESLRIVSLPPTGNLTAPNNQAIKLEGCEDCWVRDISTHDTVGCVSITSADSTRITIERVMTSHTKSIEKGAGYPADFLVRGSRVLIHRCSCAGDGAFFYASLGPSDSSTVVLNCDFHGKGSIQPHMRWNTGLLVDSCRVRGGRIEFINRGTSGSGHGWAIGWAVAWNCMADSYLIQQPPGAMNWAIGCRGTLQKTCPKEGFYSHGTPVVPASLYLDQLRERLGEAAVKNIGY
jgi:hypothetical protein